MTLNQDQADIGVTVRELREDAGMSQGALARAAHISQGYLSRIEDGRANPTIGHLHWICRALDATITIQIGDI